MVQVADNLEVHARPGGQVVYIDASLIRVSEKKQRKLSLAKIREYAANYERGDEFPPITVEDCGGFYTVRDGRHRFQAQLLGGYTMIAVTVYNS